MLNLALGEPASVDGISAILTRKTASGFALFGPYVEVPAGSYEISFTISVTIEDDDCGEVPCASIDVASDLGRQIIASGSIAPSWLASGRASLKFSLPAPAILEFRVMVHGTASLLISDSVTLVETCQGDPSPVSTPDVPAPIGILLRTLFDHKVPAKFQHQSLVVPVNNIVPAAMAGHMLTLADGLSGLLDSELYRAFVGNSEPIRTTAVPLGLASTPCRQLHFSLDEFRFWMKAMGRLPRLHRKEWEWFYIAQSLFERGQLELDKRGLVFAVGVEPLPAVFAARGCTIVATDQSPEQALQSGWLDSQQYSAQVENLYDEAVCPADQFYARVTYRSVDMNAIPTDLEGQFDFCWSSCACEHLGSIANGLSFIENSLATLVPGGIAVHTTEFNLSSNDQTMETPGLSLFRRRDIEGLIQTLEQAGHRVSPMDWATDGGFIEHVVDLPPYNQNPHLRLQIEGFDCTSIGLIIQKANI